MDVVSNCGQFAYVLYTRNSVNINRKAIFHTATQTRRVSPPATSIMPPTVFIIDRYPSTDLVA